ncbi:MAG: hypothetical protein KDD70_08105 [Bdellovibrionales bacterium]|nr:hypothetical protein [Bdellovibrionales bacterium]
MTLRRILSSFSVVSVLLLCASTSFAQTCDNEEGLQACSHVAIENCRSDNSCADDRRVALSKQDVIEDAAADCCSRNGSASIRQCVKRYLRRLRQGIKRVPAGLKGFLREANQGVKELQTNGCSTGTLGSL